MKKLFLKLKKILKDLTIDNDLILVEEAIREYYEIQEEEKNAETK